MPITHKLFNSCTFTHSFLLKEKEEAFDPAKTKRTLTAAAAALAKIKASNMDNRNVVVCDNGTGVTLLLLRLLSDDLIQIHQVIPFFFFFRTQ